MLIQSFRMTQEVSKMLLNQPLVETDFSPAIVIHPYFSSGNVFMDGEFVDILNNEENLSKARKQYEEIIDNANSYMDLFVLLREPYYLTFLKYAKDTMDARNFSELLGYAWVTMENPNMDANVSIDEALKMFSHSMPLYLMEKEDYEKWCELTDPSHGVANQDIVVYRGVAKGRTPNGISWTQSLEKAKWFASRFGDDGYVLKGTCHRRDIKAYFNTRNEDEIVVKPYKVERI